MHVLCSTCPLIPPSSGRLSGRVLNLCPRRPCVVLGEIVDRIAYALSVTYVTRSTNPQYQIHPRGSWKRRHLQRGALGPNIRPLHDTRRDGFCRACSCLHDAKWHTLALPVPSPASGTLAISGEEILISFWDRCCPLTFNDMVDYTALV